MKKIYFTLCLICSIVLLCSCGPSNTAMITELTEKDYKYIDTVYNTMSKWDITMRDGSEDYHIDKISIQDFDGTNKIVFYKNYPIIENGCYGYGYYIKENGLEKINPDIYDNDTAICHEGCLMQTVTNGTVWDYTATDEEKYETIKNAYIKFLETNIKND